MDSEAAGGTLKHKQTGFLKKSPGYVYQFHYYKPPSQSSTLLYEVLQSQRKRGMRTLSKSNIARQGKKKNTFVPVRRKFPVLGAVAIYAL